MKVEFRQSFAKDLKGVAERGLLKRVKDVIEAVERADSLTDISNLKEAQRRRELFPLESWRLSSWRFS